MSEQYNEYLTEHICNVQKGLEWLVSNEIIPQFTDTGIPTFKISMNHDASKYYPEEYSAYDDYFYGKEGKDQDDIAVIDSCFDYAWLHHIHKNPHHWQYWLLFEDEGNIKALEMPRQYVYEMIADWWAFSWRSGNLREIFDWYKAHKRKMKLHEKTKELVEDILKQMDEKLPKEDSTHDKHDS